MYVEITLICSCGTECRAWADPQATLGDWVLEDMHGFEHGDCMVPRDLVEQCTPQFDKYDPETGDSTLLSDRLGLEDDRVEAGIPSAVPQWRIDRLLDAEHEQEHAL